MKGLFSIIHESSVRYPEKTFIRNKNRDWTYREVEPAALKVSELISGYGVQKGDRVVIFCDNSIEYVLAYFGTLAVNAIAVPVNPARTADNIMHIVNKCSPKLIIACISTIDKLNRATKGLLENIISIDFGDLWDSSSKVCGPETLQYTSAHKDDPAVILFTSGTTAYPKGVTLTHGNLLANTEAIIEYLHLTSEDSILMTLPFTYSYGNSILLTHAFMGASVIIENSTAFPYKVLEKIRDQEVTGFSTVGSYINLMLKYIKSTDTEADFFDKLRYITLAGESANNSDIDFICKNFPNVKLYVMYGQTEASARLSYLDPELLPEKIGSIGKGLSNVELKVVDETGMDIRPGEIGEIIARGPNIMKCYWEDPEATKEVLKGGWLYTGDKATVDEEGYIYVKGRKTDMIKYMGHRISPLEIENVINSFSYVKESAVVESTKDDVPIIKAFVVMEKDCPSEDIRRYVYSKLPVFMRPQVFEIVARLPRTDTGKIMRSALR